VNLEDIPEEILEGAAAALWGPEDKTGGVWWPSWETARERAGKGLFDLPEMVDDTYDLARSALLAALPLYRAAVLREAAEKYSRHPELSTTWGDVAADLRDDACEAGGVCSCGDLRD
jgi:hypothetical protein